MQKPNPSSCITLARDETLPKICAMTGSEDADFKMIDEIRFNQGKAIFVPRGYNDIDVRTIRIVYYLTEPAYKKIMKKRRINKYLLMAIFACFFTGPLLSKNFYLFMLLLAVFLCLTLGVIWNEKSIRNPYKVVNSNASTITLAGLPPNLVSAHEITIAKRKILTAPKKAT